MKYDYDLIVIGGGSGGVRAARLFAQSSYRVALCEVNKLGGTCVNRGCVPKKIIHEAAHILHDAKYSQKFGINNHNPNFSWSTLAQNINNYISKLNNSYHSTLTNAGVTIINGFASLVDENTVLINDKKITTERSLIAVGGKPVKPDIEGAEFALVSDDIFSLKELPESMVVVGAGYIAVEIASIFHALGCKTQIVHRRNHLLRGFDQHTAHHFTKSVKELGIKMNLETNVSAIKKISNQRLAIKLNNGQIIDTQHILFATGRTPNLDGLGLENLKSYDPHKFFKGNKIVTNDSYQTTIPSIYAVGDINSYAAELTPVAIRQSAIMHAMITGASPPPLDPLKIPTAVFSIPPMGFIGISEELAHQYAKNKKLSLSVWRSLFPSMKSSFQGNTLKNHYKLLTIGDDHEIISIFLVGDGVDEILQPLAIAMQNTLLLSDFQNTIAIHPTAAEELLTPSLVATFNYDK